MARVTSPLFLLLSIAFGVLAEQQLRFEGYQLLAVFSRDHEDVKFLNDLGETYVDLDFWRDPVPQQNATVLVPPTLLGPVKTKLTSRGITFVIMSDDVQSIVDAGSARTPQEEVNRKRQISNAVIDHYNYHTYNTILGYLQALKNRYTNNVELSNLNYVTHEGRVVALVKLVGRASSEKKPAILVEAGIHAREWVSPAANLWAIEKLLSDYASGVATAVQILDKYDWYFVPVANPDGYEYTHTTNRMWRKNKRYVSARCTGVDLNRNFDAMWGTTGISRTCSSDIYLGEAPFSEPETANLRDLFESIIGEVVAYLSVHSYSQFLLVPWGYTEYVSRPPNAAELDRVATRMTQALIARFGTQYYMGTAWQLLNYAASGSSKDYALRRKPNLYAMAYELRPSASSSIGFNLPASQIVPTGQEYHDSLVALAQEIRV